MYILLIQHHTIHIQRYNDILTIPILPLNLHGLYHAPNGEPVRSSMVDQRWNDFNQYYTIRHDSG